MSPFQGSRSLGEPVTQGGAAMALGYGRLPRWGKQTYRQLSNLRRVAASSTARSFSAGSAGDQQPQSAVEGCRWVKCRKSLRSQELTIFFTPPQVALASTRRRILDLRFGTMGWCSMTSENNFRDSVIQTIDN